MFFISAVYLILSLFVYITKIQFFNFITENDVIGGFRMSGFSNIDALDFGRKLLWPFFVVSSYYLFAKRGKIPFVPLLFVISILLSFSRTTYLSSLFGLLFIIFMKYGKFKVKTIITFVAIFFSLFLLVKIFGVISVFTTTDRGSVANLDVRLQIQAVALRIIAANPLFGSFPGGLFPALRHFGYEYRMMSVHSFYLSTPVEWGVILGFAIIAINIISVVLHIRNLKKLKKVDISFADALKSFSLGGAATALALFIHGIAEVVPLSLIFLNLGIAVSIHRLLQTEESQTLSPNED